MKKCKHLIKNVEITGHNSKEISYNIIYNNELIFHNFQGPARISLFRGSISEIFYYCYGQQISKDGIMFIGFYDSGDLFFACWGNKYGYKRCNAVTKYYWKDYEQQHLGEDFGEVTIQRSYDKGKHFDNISKYIEEAKQWL